jgi:hypothetical protein
VVGETQQVATNIQKPARPTDPIKIDLSKKDEPVYGRRVSIELLNNYLSLAEVEVWGELYSSVQLRFLEMFS